MLTIFAVPKPFLGHIGVIQRNAITSWTLLRPAPEIILFGDEEGTRDIANELGLKHAPGVARNEFGTPLLSDVFQQAQNVAKNEVLCYINADILLMNDFADAVAKITEKLSRFLIVSRRINIDVPEPVRFTAGWEVDFRKQVMVRGVFASAAFIDVFAFPKEIFGQVPAFAIGRPWFDHWFIREARKTGLAVVEVSPCAPIIHQNHDYGHVRGGLEAIWASEETQRNLKLYGMVFHDFTLADATHQLLPDGKLRESTLPKRSYSLRNFVWELLIQKTFSFRRRLGLSRKTFRSLGVRWRRG